MTLRTSGTALALVLACLPPLQLQARETPPPAAHKAATPARAEHAPPATPPNTPPSTATLGLEALGRLLGYLTLFAAIAAVTVYFAKHGLPFSKKTSREDRKLHILEMRPLGNRQFLLVVAYEETRLLLGVTPGKIDYLCPLDSHDSTPRDFSSLLKTEPSPGATT